MKALEFSIDLNATREKVWNALWDEDNYRKWTNVFSEGSQVKTDNWKKDSKIFFVDNTGDGMVARVVENQPPERMSFEHLGQIKNGVEDTESEAVKIWAGNRESYFLSETEKGTSLRVTLSIPDDYADYFENTWPRALEEVKAIAEK